MKRYFSLLTALFITTFAIADNGMWLPSQISMRIADMQSKGLKLSAEDIYSLNQPSLKDAVVLFNGGCSGELISDEGLLITNYHCGHSLIQAHSSVGHDYLKDGFWAMTRDQELPNKRIFVRFLVYMDDVTDIVLSGYKSGMSEAQRDSIIEVNGKPVIEAAEKEGVGYSARIAPLYYGNQYFIWVYQTFTDVRLVGAPPAAVGKFGGDTDNWMWPRHTGDFSLFRIYADKNNNPAPYSADNVPYTPKKHFKMSLKERREGDFTFVYGYPGTTQEYIYSEKVKYISEASDPHKRNLRTLRLDVQKKYMSADPAVRIKYSAKNASVANSWKKWLGEMNGIRKMKTYEEKKAFESQFAEWAANRPEYSWIIPRFELLYLQWEKYAFATDYYNESIRANEIISLANSIRMNIMQKKSIDVINAYIDDFYKNYYLPIDKECFILLLRQYRQYIPDAYRPAYFSDMIIHYGTMQAWVDAIYEKSALTNVDAAKELVKRAVEAGDDYAAVLLSDPACEFEYRFKTHYDENISNVYDYFTEQIDQVYRYYMKGQMEMCQEKEFFPDANLTLRVAYGNIQGYSPADGIYYKPVSTLEGIMQKDNPDIFDYNIPQELRDIYAAKDYGRYAVNGTVPVCFIATNHTTGGNSGSPVLDGDGNLIGINFDRVWEGTMSDIVFDPDVCRNISLDMRYVLFYIDRLSGARQLLNEIETVE